MWGECELTNNPLNGEDGPMIKIMPQSLNLMKNLKIPTTKKIDKLYIVDGIHGNDSLKLLNEALLERYLVKVHFRP